MLRRNLFLDKWRVRVICQYRMRVRLVRITCAAADLSIYELTKCVRR